MVDIDWFMQVPVKISLIPFDHSAIRTAQGPLYEKAAQKIQWTETVFGVQPFEFIASEF